MVMPLHPPKFPFGVRFALSMLACAQLESYVFFPAFSSADENASFFGELGDALQQRETSCGRGDRGAASSLPVHSLVVPVDPRNPPVSKKLLAMHAAFSQFDVKYAVALDAEVEFQSTKRFDDYFSQWGRRRQVAAFMLAAASEQHHGGRNSGGRGLGVAGDPFNSLISTESCAAAGLPPLPQPMFSWFSDAPIFDRADYWDFLRRFDWARLSWYVFDHESYLCYKVSKQGWRVVPTAAPLERQPAAAQRTQAPGLAFLWSRDVAPDRLLRFHTDRDLIDDTTVAPVGPAGAPCCAV
tara:strand:- start:202 stop:1092 length:891 start_codon:yes stop_codon:yes gene_type:complete